MKVLLYSAGHFLEILLWGGAILRIVKRGWGETEAFSEPFSEGGKKPPLSPQKQQKQQRW